VNLYFSSVAGTVYPNGELVVSRITPLPSFPPDSANAFHLTNYYIINNYGTNSSFTALDSLQFSGLNLINGYTAPGNYSLYKRPSMAYGNASWGNSLGNAFNLSGSTNGDGQLRFPGSSVTSFSQFVIAAPKICGMKSSSILTSAASVCSGSGTNLSLSEAYDKNLYSFTWYSSSASNGTYSQIGKDSAGLATGPLNGTTYYKCTITCKSSTPNTFTTPAVAVQVTAPYTFSSQPSTAAVTYCQGATASPVSVSVGSGPVSKYEWYQNNAASTSGGTRVATTTSTALSNSYTPSTASNGVTYYYAIVYAADGCNTKSNVSGAITISTGPVISAQPSAATISYCTGMAAAALTVTASISSGSLSYQWYSNTINATSGATSIRGATASSYIPATSTTGTRYYYVIVNPTATCKATSTLSGAITVNATPATPNSLSVSGGTSKNGVLSNCPVITPTATTYTYTSSTVTNAASYEWLLPACATGTAGTLPNSIAVKYSGIKSTDSIKVRAKSSTGCNSAFRTVKVTGASNCLPTCNTLLTYSIPLQTSASAIENSLLQTTLFPNPSYHDFMLTVSTISREKVQLNIIDLQGRPIRQMEMEPDATLRFGSELTAGVYILSIAQGKQTIYRKLVKY
jgi:hypothetical protein